MALYRLETSEEALSTMYSLMLCSFSPSPSFDSLLSSDFERFASPGVLYYLSEEGVKLELAIGSSISSYFLLFLSGEDTS
jgi:hypothetical protein